ncbi:unnamed protein product [Pedinophyceae sp. YPF-701]|nr:unnamed protein product [Pedinophyceae sp. YPF-701]
MVEGGVAQDAASAAQPPETDARLQAAAVTVQRHVRGMLARKDVDVHRRILRARDRMERIMRAHRERSAVVLDEQRRMEAMNPVELERWTRERERAATAIQAAWRGHLQRRATARLHPHFPTPALPRAPLRESSSLGDHSRLDPSITASLPDSVRAVLTAVSSPRASAPTAAAAVANPDVWGSTLAPDGTLAIGAERRAALAAQIADDVAATRAAHQLPLDDAAARALAERCAELCRERDARRVESTAAVFRQRRLRLQVAALQRSLAQRTPLLELPEGLQPHQVPVPPKGSTRRAAAARAHALALAESGVPGLGWWRGLADVGGELGEFDAEFEALDARAAAAEEHWRRTVAREQAAPRL